MSAAPVIATIVETLSGHPAVAAIALGGSRATGRGDHDSDHDIYIFVNGEVPLQVRRDLAERFDPAPEIGNAWFGPGDEWADPATGAAIDLVYFERDWFEGAIRDVLERHRPALGYTTAFWHTLRHAEPRFDRDGWLAMMQPLAATPYPDPLRRNIVAWNHPVLRSARSSYRHQVELAIARDDPVSVNHRVAALLASVFDIVFALARTPHPGEKRLLDHLTALGDAVPAALDPQVRTVLRAAAAPADLLPAIDALCDTLDAAVRAHGLGDAIDRP